MKHRIPYAAGLLAMLICVANVRFAAVADGTTVGVGVGTLGAALSISQVVDPKTTLRFTYGNFEFTRHEQYNNVVIDVLTNLRLSERFRVQSAGLYAERSLRSPFHITFGVVANQNHIAAVSIPADSSITINHYVYSAVNAGEIFTDVKWTPVSPYIGFGFRPRLNSRHRLGLVGEIGAYYEGRATVTFDANGAIKANQSNFQKYFDDLKHQLSRELSPVQVYPVLQIGLQMRI